MLIIIIFSLQFFSWFSQVQTQMEENKEKSYKYALLYYATGNF